MKNDMPVTLLALGSPLHDARVVAAIKKRMAAAVAQALGRAPRLASASMNFPDSGHSPVSGGSGPGFPSPGAGPRPPPAAARPGAAPSRAGVSGAGGR